METKTESKFEFEIVSDDARQRNSLLDDPMVQTLLTGKTIRVRNLPKATSIYKIALSNGKKLHARSDGEEYTVAWMEDIQDPADE